MSNFAELSCFNKLLLKKMQRMENDYKRLEKNYNFIRKKNCKNYNELVSLKNCVCMDDVEKCEQCDLWADEDDIWRVGDVSMCKRCYDEKNCYCCDNCGEDYCPNEMKKMHLDFNNEDVCNRCFKGYRILFSRAYYDLDLNGDVINEMVYNRDKVMEELLKKIKTN